MKINGSPGCWTQHIVVNFKARLELLVGSKSLEAMGFLLNSIAAEKKQDIQATYELATESDKELPVEGEHKKAPVVQKKMQVAIGLPDRYFTELRDEVYKRYNSMYPEVSRENIASRLVTHCKEETIELLLDTLVMHKAALREYPSGCPPPAAYALIMPPMKDKAKILFVAQHMLGGAAYKSREKFVEKCIEYGIDEPGKTHAQVPIFLWRNLGLLTTVYSLTIAQTAHST
ncbi:hypothetical protein BDF14DRAFT_366521 [Spinellus fusiger]|nr:hypothetical protein BDF14DRAFT_366521 [Spinellus fusiger]